MLLTRFFTSYATEYCPIISDDLLKMSMSSTEKIDSVKTRNITPINRSVSNCITSLSKRQITHVQEIRTTIKLQTHIKLFIQHRIYLTQVFGPCSGCTKHHPSNKDIKNITYILTLLIHWSYDLCRNGVQCTHVQ